MLLRQDRGRNQDRRLLAAAGRQEGCPQRHLGLAVADVAADEAVHGNGLLHVGQDVVDRLELVRRFFVGEAGLEIPEITVRGGETRSRRPPCAAA